MKLIISVVNDKDAPELLENLIKGGYRATKLSSTGGFLKEGNTTYLIVVTDSQVDEVVSRIKEVCYSRKEMVSPISPMVGLAESYVAYPTEVTVGGAMIFVMDVEQSIRV
jgi:uncharacterized protein YaaQ